MILPFDTFSFSFCFVLEKPFCHINCICIFQREEILASRQRRAKQLEAMLDESKARLADHNNKRKILTDGEKESLEKKISIYTRKLETLQGDFDEREIERIIRKEKIRNEHINARRAKEEL